MDIKGKMADKQTAPKANTVARDFSRAKRDAGAASTEFKQFMTELRGRSPQEVLGAVAQSDLIRSTLVATFLIVGVLMAATLVPWVMAGDKPATKSTAAIDAGKTDASKTVPDSTADKTGNPDSTKSAKSATDKSATGKTGDLLDPTGAAKKLGIDEVKSGTPVDPFKNTDDDLLNP